MLTATAPAAFYTGVSYGEMLRCLLKGPRWLRWGGAEPDLADKSAITKAPTRLGVAPLKQLIARGAPGALRRRGVVPSTSGCRMQDTLARRAEAEALDQFRPRHRLAE